MKFINRHNHPVSLVDGREVGSFGECEMTPDQYEAPEQWRLLPELFVGATAKAQGVIDDADADPDKFNNKADTPSAPDNQGGQT